MAYQVFSEAPLRSGSNEGRAIFEGFGEQKGPTCPPIKFVCTCPLPDPLCIKRKQVLCDRILGAINLANRAATLLETKPLGPLTVFLFRRVFGDAPTDKWPVPGNPNRTILAGDLVARRFRAVEHELKTSNTTYTCIDDTRCANEKRSRCSTDDGRRSEGRPRLNGFGINLPRRDEVVPLPPPPPCHPTDTVVVDTVALALLCKNEVLLCPPFWKMNVKIHQEGTILHEMFHLCFGLTCSWFQHDQKERKKNSAHCYEVFACGSAADPASVTACTAVLK
jgi:hypothetical protein